MCTTFGPKRVLALRTPTSDLYRGRRLPCINPAAKQRRRQKGALLAFRNQWHLFSVAPFTNYLCTISWLLDLSHEYLAYTHWAPRPALHSDSAVSRIQATSYHTEHFKSSIAQRLDAVFHYQKSLEIQILRQHTRPSTIFNQNGYPVES